MYRHLFRILFWKLFRGTNDPKCDDFFMNWGSINPAHHGLQQHAELFTGFKAQWLGFEGAPKTTNATLSLPFNNRKSDAAMFGMGLNISNEQIGTFSNTRLQIAGAVNIQVKNEDRLSLGIGIGAVQVGYNADLISTYEQENTLQRFSSKFLPQFTAGLAYKTENYIVGLAIDDIGPKIGWTLAPLPLLAPNILFMVGIY